MGLKDKRSNIKHGTYSRVLVLPASLKLGEKSTLAANRLVLVDHSGEIGEDDLLQFLERFVEPEFWPWLKSKESQRIESG